MEIGSTSGWIAAAAVALFIIAPILYFSVFRRRG